MCTIKNHLVRMLVPGTLALLLAWPACAAQSRYVYRFFPGASTAGGPVRGGEVGAGSGASLIVVSAKELTSEKQEGLEWHCRNALRQAAAFAAKGGLTIHRNQLPMRVELYRDPGQLADATRHPQYEYGCEAVARIDLTFGIVYLGRSEPGDLYMELAKWFFYEPGFRWGVNARQDEAHQRLIANFAHFCLDKKNWVEAGGSTGGLW